MTLDSFLEVTKIFTWIAHNLVTDTIDIYAKCLAFEINSTVKIVQSVGDWTRMEGQRRA